MNKLTPKMLFIEVFGWLGAALVIGAYAFNSMGWIASESLTYQMMNVIGSVGLLIVAYIKGVYQSALVNLIWLFIALAAIAQFHIFK